MTQETKQEIKQIPTYKTYTLTNFRSLPQVSKLTEEQIHAIEVVGHVLPFKTNNYVVEELINWDNVPNDPMFVLNFPQKGMLKEEHFEEMSQVLKKGDADEIKETANKIRLQLNPHPAGQMEHNVPALKDGTKLYGMQHKYNETCLFFPSQSQTCHAYCSFCFRWPQFVGMDDLKFAMKEADMLVQYLKEHPEVTDVLFTGGDPMVMKADTFDQYITALIEAKLPNLKTIRIGTKSLSYWPYKYLNEDGEKMLDIFKRIDDAGIHLAIMAHFNHGVELETDAVQLAIKKIRQTGAQIRAQSPLLKNINDSAKVWSDMWKKEVELGCIPYYMFVVRDTGAQHYFGISLIEAQEIFKDAYQNVSGIARTVRGPSMSATPGKVQMVGVGEMGDKKVMILRFIQGRNPEWVHKPFFAEYDEGAIWLDDLKPAFGDKFFFQDELDSMLSHDKKKPKDEVSTVTKVGDNEI